MEIKTIELKKEIEARVLFDMIRDSNYMINAGYKLCYAYPCYDRSVKFNVSTFRLLPKIDSTLKSYNLGFKHPKKTIIINISIPANARQAASCFNYWISQGNRKQAEKDIKKMTKEIKEEIK